jgi:hypothetical protein
LSDSIKGAFMKLSDGEKLIILMLADMYKAMKIDGEFDPGLRCHDDLQRQALGL